MLPNKATVEILALLQAWVHLSKNEQVLWTGSKGYLIGTNQQWRLELSVDRLQLYCPNSQSLPLFELLYLSEARQSPQGRLQAIWPLLKTTYVRDVAGELTTEHERLMLYDAPVYWGLDTPPPTTLREMVLDTVNYLHALGTLAVTKDNPHHMSQHLRKNIQICKTS